MLIADGVTSVLHDLVAAWGGDNMLEKILDFRLDNLDAEFFFFNDEDVKPLIDGLAPLGRPLCLVQEMYDFIPIHLCIERLEEITYVGLRLRHSSKRYARDSNDILRWC